MNNYGWAFVRHYVIAKWLREHEAQGYKIVSASICRFWFRLHVFVIFIRPDEVSDYYD